MRYVFIAILVPLLLILAYKIWKSKWVTNLILDIFGNSPDSAAGLVKERESVEENAKRVQKNIVDKRESLSQDIKTLS